MPLAASLVFDHPTAGAVAAQLTERLAPPADRPAGRRSFGDLDRLEAALTALPAASAGPLTERLRTVLAGLSAEDSRREQLAAASDDELFDLVDNLGPA